MHVFKGFTTAEQDGACYGDPQLRHSLGTKETFISTTDSTKGPPHKSSLSLHDII